MTDVVALCVSTFLFCHIAKNFIRVCCALPDVCLPPQIPEETRQGSLLAAGLAAVKKSAPQSGLGGLLAGARQRDDTMTLSDGESLMGDPRVDHSTDHGPGGCTVSREMLDRFCSRKWE